MKAFIITALVITLAVVFSYVMVTYEKLALTVTCIVLGVILVICVMGLYDVIKYLIR